MITTWVMDYKDLQDENESYLPYFMGINRHNSDNQMKNSSMKLSTNSQFFDSNDSFEYMDQ